MEDSTRKARILKKFTELYGTKPEIWVRAPGRVDLMGSHTDYNLGFVMTMTIDRDTWIAAVPDSKPKMTLYSMNLQEGAEADLRHPRKSGAPAWIDYPAGVAWAFMEKGYPAPGFKGIVDSTIPIGSGLSSSAAFECAAAVLFKEMADVEIDPLETAELCRQAENSFVGMNCGILDQYSSMLGEKSKTILLDCKNLTHITVPFPDGFTAFICNTNAPRKLTGTEYAERRAQCEDAAARLGRYYEGVKTLRDVTRKQFFQYQGEMPNLSRKRSRFIIEENERVTALSDAFRHADRKKIGKLFHESFTGARDLFEITIPPMEEMIKIMLKAPGAAAARQAGAGFGGCMIGMVSSEAGSRFASYISSEYPAATGLEAEVYPVQASPGAGVMV